MGRINLLLIAVAFSLNLAIPLNLCAQAPARPTVKTNQEAPAQAGSGKSAAPSLGVIKDLPVRKVVLYKNGVGYFEHAGTVNGSQRVAIDFTSQQLNDVLQSLTVLDEGGGRIAGVNFNSTTPIEEQLKTLALGLKALSSHHRRLPGSAWPARRSHRRGRSSYRQAREH